MMVRNTGRNQWTASPEYELHLPLGQFDGVQRKSIARYSVKCRLLVVNCQVSLDSEVFYGVTVN